MPTQAGGRPRAPGRAHRALPGRPPAGRGRAVRRSRGRHRLLRHRAVPGRGRHPPPGHARSADRTVQPGPVPRSPRAGADPAGPHRRMRRRHDRGPRRVQDMSTTVSATWSATPSSSPWPIASGRGCGSPTPSPGWAATSSPSWSTRSTPPTGRDRWPSGCSTPWSIPCPFRVRRWPSGPAWASPSPTTARPRPTASSPTPTPPCTRPSGPARAATRYSGRTCTRRPSSG